VSDTTIAKNCNYAESATSVLLLECDYITFGSLLSQIPLSVCNVGAPYSGGWSCRQYLFTAVYFSHPRTSLQNLTEIVPGKPLHRRR